MDKNIDEKILDKATELRIKLGEDLHDHVMESIYSEAAKKIGRASCRERV